VITVSITDITMLIFQPESMLRAAV